MPPKSSKVKKNPPQPKILSITDVTCTVCCDYYTKPVLLPCSHRVCKSCLENICNLSNIECPLCRKRLNTWIRTNKIIKTGASKFIDTKFEKLVTSFQQANPFATIETWDYISNTKKPPKINSGESSGQYEGSAVDSEVVTGSQNNFTSFTSSFSRTLSKPGEVRQEYLESKNKMLTEKSKQEKELEQQSLNFINIILKEEKQTIENQDFLLRRKEREMQEKLDSEYAKKLHYEINKTKVVKFAAPTSPTIIMTRSRSRVQGFEIKESIETENVQSISKSDDKSDDMVLTSPTIPPLEPLSNIPDIDQPGLHISPCLIEKSPDNFQNETTLKSNSIIETNSRYSTLTIDQHPLPNGTSTPTHSKKSFENFSDKVPFKPYGYSEENSLNRIKFSKLVKSGSKRCLNEIQSSENLFEEHSVEEKENISDELKYSMSRLVVNKKRRT